MQLPPEQSRGVRRSEGFWESDPGCGASHPKANPSHSPLWAARNQLEMGSSMQLLVPGIESEEILQIGRPSIMEAVPNMQTQLLCQLLLYWQPVKLLQAQASMPYLTAWHPRPHHQSHSPILDAPQFAELLFCCHAQQAITIIKMRDDQYQYSEPAGFGSDIEADTSNLTQVV